MSLLTLLLSCSGGASDGDGPKANPRERTLVIAETADHVFSGAAADAMASVVVAWLSTALSTT